LVVGDHTSDIAAAEAAGCHSVHLRSGRGAPPEPPSDRYLGSLPSLLSVAEALRQAPHAPAGNGHWIEGARHTAALRAPVVIRRGRCLSSLSRGCPSPVLQARPPMDANRPSRQVRRNTHALTWH
jgi:hypothetical protein